MTTGEDYTTDDGTRIRVAVISARRPQNVPLMQEHLAGIPHTWVVPLGQKGDYVYAGAEAAIETTSTQDTHQRNFALRCWANRIVVQIDDDLKRIKWTEPQSGGAVEINLHQAIQSLVVALRDTGAYYAGIAPTDNHFFTQRRITSNGFIRSALTAYRPGSDLLYDDAFPLKGDYDLTCQHLAKYGQVARVDSLLGSFAFGQGSGGCVDYRTPELENEVVAKLVAKWPHAIRPNPTRPGEVLLRWPAKEPETAGLFR